MAGESAREVARARRAKAERLERMADAYERGADGEQATAAALAALPWPEWIVIHDVRWPGRQRANIDHVVVGPGGVFVIDTKSWSGKMVESVVEGDWVSVLNQIGATTVPTQTTEKAGLGGQTSSNGAGP